MEIPDSDEEEEEISLPPTTPPNNNNNNNQHDDQDQDQDQDPKEQKQPIPSTTTTHFIDRILTQLNHITTRAKNQHHNRHGEQEHEVQRKVHGQAQKKNPLSSLSPSVLSQVKPLMLTLHCLFSNELLPALDTLDRGLIRRLVLQGHGRELSSPATNTDESPSREKKEEEEGKEEAIFFVISASNTSTAMTGTAEDEKEGYEVRLQAWNCTCTQFLLSAFPDADADPILQPGSDANNNDNDNSPERHRDEADSTEPEWGRYRFGGSLTRGLSPLPVCKHLLACTLFVRCPELFGEESHIGPCRRLVSVEELAAWCAGWGDS